MNKKKVTKRHVVHKSRHSIKRVRFNRDSNWIIYVGSCIGVLLVVVLFVGFSHKRALRQTVAGISIMNGVFAQATVPLPDIPNATAFNVYYWPELHSESVNAARGVPTNISSYTVTYLSKNTKYEYRISALDPNGAEFWWSPVTDMTNITSM